MEESLTKSQVQDIVDFAAGLAYGEQYGVWSPFMSNSLLQNLNNDARVATSESVRKALATYRESADTIQSYMEYMRVFDMLFAKTVKSYVNALAFDLQFVCVNAKDSDYGSDAYLADKRRIDDFLLKFDYRGEFRKVVEQLLTHEVYYTWFRSSRFRCCRRIDACLRV